MPDNSAKCLCRIRSLLLPQSLNFPYKHKLTKPTKASRTRSGSQSRRKVYYWEEFCRIDEVDEDENGVGATKKPWLWSLKEFLHRSISKCRRRAREKEIERERLVQAALRVDKKKKKKKPISKKLKPLQSATPRPVQRCCAVSAHERYYWANRAEVEQLKKKTFLPYRKGLLGFFGPFQSSKSGIHYAPLSVS